MKNVTTSAFASAVCVLLLAVPMAAANRSAGTTRGTTAAKPSAPRSAWAAETISGTITMVDPVRGLVVVRGPDGVPYDMAVTAKTRILSNNRVLTLQDLAQDQNQDVSVQYVPERRGDVAKAIRVGG